MALEANMGLTTEDIQKFSDQSIPEPKTYAIDWVNGRLSGQITGLEAVQQYIYKTLKTECNRYLIYDTKVGSGIKALVKQGSTSRDYLETDIPRLVKNALTDSRVLGVHDFSFEYPDDERDAVKISFIADTIYGSTSEEVTID
ncbi:MAG: DUF2634 domain-containing protein [Lachnospiraceae bacterium]|nr:DUF2634 domain-containing protein [Lachnospiraceae bacterium]